MCNQLCFTIKSVLICLIMFNERICVNANYPVAIRRPRAKLNFSQEDLAKLLGVSFMSVNRWENGHFEPAIIVKEKLIDLFVENNIKLESFYDN